MEGRAAEASPAAGADLRAHSPAGMGGAGGCKVVGQHQGQGPIAPGRQVEAPGDGQVEARGPPEFGQHHGHRAGAQGLVHHPQRLGLGAHLDQAQPVGIEPQGVETGGVGVTGLDRRFAGLDQQTPRPGRHEGAAHQGEAEPQGRGARPRDLVRSSREAAAADRVDPLVTEAQGRRRGVAAPAVVRRLER